MGYLKHFRSPCVCEVMHTLGRQRSTKNNTYLRPLPQQGAFSVLANTWYVERVKNDAVCFKDDHVQSALQQRLTKSRSSSATEECSSRPSTFECSL